MSTKSLSKKLTQPGSVSYRFWEFPPFGIEIFFKKSRRKTSDGKAETWYGGKCRPLVDVVRPTYNEAEALAALALTSTITRGDIAIDQPLKKKGKSTARAKPRGSRKAKTPKVE